MTQYGGTPPDDTSEWASTHSPVPHPPSVPPSVPPPPTPATPPYPTPMADWPTVVQPAVSTGPGPAGPPPGAAPWPPAPPPPPGAAPPPPGPAQPPQLSADTPPPGSPPPGSPPPGSSPSGSGAPAGQPAARPARAALHKRGPVIATVVLAIVLLLCGVGGTFSVILLRQVETGEGAPDPAAAVDGFLRAIYHERDARKAAAMVCSEARDAKAIDKKIDEVDELRRTYQRPRFKWESPQIEQQNSDRAIVFTELTMTTADEKISTLPLRFTVVQRTGWWICEVN